MAQAQNAKNHSRVVPAFHFFVLPMLTINFGWSIYYLKSHFSANSVIASLTAAALLLGFLYSRMFALTVQDRVIRLEMRLRLANVLPQNLRPRIGELTLGQLISLRFASDAELETLTRKVLEEKITERKAIKAMVRDWQPDELRA